MAISFHETNTGLFVTFASLSDLTVLEDWTLDELFSHASKNGKPILIDLTGTTFLSSTHLGKLVFLEAKGKSIGVHVGLASVNKNIMETIKRLNLDKLFYFDDGLEFDGVHAPNPKPDDALDAHAIPDNESSGDV